MKAASLGQHFNSANLRISTIYVSYKRMWRASWNISWHPMRISSNREGHLNSCIRGGCGCPLSLHSWRHMMSFMTWKTPWGACEQCAQLSPTPQPQLQQAQQRHHPHKPLMKKRADSCFGQNPSGREILWTTETLEPKWERQCLHFIVWRYHLHKVNSITPLLSLRLTQKINRRSWARHHHRKERREEVGCGGRIFELRSPEPRIPHPILFLSETLMKEKILPSFLVLKYNLLTEMRDWHLGLSRSD